MKHLSKFLCSAAIAGLLSTGCQKENNMGPAGGGKATSAGNQESKERSTVNNGRGQSPPGRVTYTHGEGMPFTLKKYDDGSTAIRMGTPPYPDYDPKTIMSNGGTLQKFPDNFVYTSADRQAQIFFPRSKFGDTPPHLNNYPSRTIGGGHSRSKSPSEQNSRSQSPSDHVSRSQSISTGTGSRQNTR